MGNQVEYGIRIGVSGNKAAVDGINEITQVTIESGVAAAKAAASQAKLEQQQQKFIDGLSKKVEAIGKTNSQIALMRAQELGLSDAAAPLIAKLAATEKGISNVGMSAAATSAAMRNVPAQFTDIVVSLQSGQSPMTVFMQQGGQLKDMFGGVGNASKALGTYILGLVNPFTVGAAAIGTLSYAAYQGSHEMTEYQKALIMTGNIAGVTADRLANMAAKISDSGESTKGEAAEALAALISSGNVASENLEKFAGVSVKMQKIIGISVGETAKDLSELGKSPLDAYKKLGEQYHFITKATYDQIKALIEHGKTAEAGAVAQTAYINSFDGKSDQIRTNLGTIERSWNAVRDSAKGAWDTMLGWGRKDTDEDQLQRLRTRIANDQLGLDEKKKSGNTDNKIYKEVEQRVAAMREEEKALQAIIDAKNGVAAATGQARQEEEKSIKQAEKLEAYLNAGSHQTKAQALKEEAKKFAEATAGFSKDSEEYRKAVAANALAIKDINDKFKDKNTELKKQENAYQSLVLSMKEKLAASQAELEQTANLTEGQKLRIKFDTDLREGKISATAAEREFARSIASQVGLNNILAIAEKEQLDRSKQFKDDFLARYNSGMKLVEVTDAYIASLAGSNEQAQLEASLIGRSERERKIAIEQLKVQIALNKQIKDIENSKAFEDDKTRQIQRATQAANDRKASIVVEVNTDEIQKARKELDAFLDPAKAQSFGDALAGALGNAGSAFQKLSAQLQEYARTEAELAKARANAELGKSTNPMKYAQDMAEINERSARAQINNYANITGAAKGFFAEGTRGYKALEAAENAFRVVQLASDLAKGMSAAVVGIANQAQGDPYTALPRMAAMAAAMASLGFATGFFGAGGSGAGMSAADMQKQQGTGSVFGDLSAKSESITKSIEEMSQTSNRLLPVNVGMLAALKNIESSMAGFTNLVVRDQGVVNGSNLDIRTGTIDRSSMSTMTAVLLTGIMAPVTKWLASLWGKTTQNIVDSGVQFGGRLSDLQSGSGFSQYASVDTTSSSWFGLKKTTSNSVQSQALSAELSSQLGLIFSNMSVALKEANKALGGSSDEITKTLENLTLTSTKVSLKGLSGQALTDALNGVISKSLDEMAQAAFPQYDKFREVGEGYAQTVLRVANTFASVNQSLSELHLKLFEAGQQGIAASIGFATAMGGLENLQSAASSYYQNFFSEAERNAAVLNSISTELSKLGIAMPVDRIAYRAALEKASADGQLDAVAALLKLNDAFASVVKQADSATASLRTSADILAERTRLQDEFDQLSMTSAQLLERQRNSIDKSNQSLYDSVQALKEKANAESSAQQKVAEAEAEKTRVLQSQLGVLESVVNRWQGLTDQLHQFSDSLAVTTGSPEQRFFAAQAQYQETLKRAKAGDEKALSNITAAAKTFLDANGSYNGTTKIATDVIQNVQDDMKELTGKADDQLSMAKAQLVIFKSQYGQLITIDKSVLSVKDAVKSLQEALKPAAKLATKTPTTYDEHFYGLNPDGSRRQMVGETAAEYIASMIPNAQRTFIESLYSANPNANAPDRDGVSYWVEQLDKLGYLGTIDAFNEAVARLTNTESITKPLKWEEFQKNTTTPTVENTVVLNSINEQLAALVDIQKVAYPAMLESQDSLKEQVSGLRKDAVFESLKV